MAAAIPAPSVQLLYFQTTLSSRTGRTVFSQLTAAVVRHKANDVVVSAIGAWFKYDTALSAAGASIPMGQGGHVPPIFALGDMITNAPPNISRVISATFYPCNIFLIS